MKKYSDVQGSCACEAALRVKSKTICFEAELAVAALGSDLRGSSSALSPETCPSEATHLDTMPSGRHIVR